MSLTTRFASGLLLVCLLVPTPARAQGRVRSGFILKACAAVLAGAAAGGAWWWYQPAPPQPSLELNAEAVVVEGVTPDATIQHTNLFGDLLKNGPVKLDVTTLSGGTGVIRLFKDTPRQWFIAGIAKSEIKKSHPEIADEPWFKDRGLSIPVRSVEFELSRENSDYVVIKLKVPFAELVSKEKFLKADLTAGQVKEIEFQNSDEPTDSGKWVRIRARMAIQYVPQERAFRILEGRVRLSITEADENEVVETSTDVITDLRSRPLFR